MIKTKHLSGTVIYSVTEKKPLGSAEVTDRVKYNESNSTVQRF